MNRLKHLPLLVFVLFTQLACTMNDLPRNMSLKAFDPHRPSFTCKHEADAVPPIDPEAEQWLQQGLALTSQTLWPDERDYAKAVQLWQQAADRKHWKAMLNLASLYAHGEGVQKDTERAVQIVEAAMKLGIPGAYDVMGTYHMEGRGVKQDASRAYAFWELAADMGSASAQAYLGSKLDAIYDDAQGSFWGNRKVGLKMLECGFTQGNGKAAYRLGGTIQGTRPELDEDNTRALHVLHEGVKFGSAESAGYLFGTFDDGDPMVNNIKDRNRAERYSLLADALRRDPDLRLPNLDKVLPLPPARLPMWDGKKETLINAAKAVVPVPPVPPKPAPNPASQRTGRAHIPEGWTLPEKPQAPVSAQPETTSAPESGYWIARLLRPTTERHIAWDEAQVPLRYEKGELFNSSRPGLQDEDGRIRFHYLGQPVARSAAEPDEHPLVARGIARYGDVPEFARPCRGNATCPQTGVWSASVPDDHPMSAVFNQWHRQDYLTQGNFPDPKAQYLDIDARAVTWRWLANANEVRGEDTVYVSVDDPVARNPIAQANDHASPRSDASAKTISAPETDPLPLGQGVVTGDACPQTGWWRCIEESAPVQAGQRQFFRTGERMPHAVLLGERSLWQKLKGEQPSYKTATVWKLVGYDEQPVPPATKVAGASADPAVTNAPGTAAADTASPTKADDAPSTDKA